MIMASASSTPLATTTTPDANTRRTTNTHYQYNGEERVVLNDSVVTVKGSTFEKCERLLSITLPITVVRIQQEGFTLNGVPPISKPITSLCFSQCSLLVAVNVPSSVIVIGQKAFSYCYSLRSIEIPSSVTEIEFEAFCECSSLVSVILPNTLQSIGYHAFHSCESLVSMAAPFATAIDEDISYNTKLSQRQTNDRDELHTERWLCRRFYDLPIHQACYNNTQTLTVDLLSNLITENSETLAHVDATGMSVLHILCCNPKVTAGMICVVQRAMSSVVMENFDEARIDSPLSLFIKCRNLLPSSFVNNFTPTTSLQDLLRSGVLVCDLECIYALKGESIGLDAQVTDESTELLPFMLAATNEACGLDMVFLLAMMIPGLLRRD